MSGLNSNWYVLPDLYRKKRTYVVARLRGHRGRIEYVKSERTGGKKHFFEIAAAQQHADGLNAGTTAKEKQG